MSEDGSETAAPAVTASRLGRWRLSLAAAGILAAGLLVWTAGFRRPLPKIPQYSGQGASRSVVSLLTDLRERLQRQPESATAWGDYGMALMQHERPAEALQCFAAAALLAPQDARWPHLSGVILEQTDVQRATERYAAAVGLQPDAAQSGLRLVSVLLTQGQFQAAESRLQQLAERFPHEPDVWLQRIRLARLMDAPDQALHWLQAARQQQAVSDLLLREVAGIRLQQGQADEARQLLEESRHTQPHTAARDPWLEQLRAFDASGAVASAQADLQRQQGRLDQAVRTLSTLASRFPERSRPALNRALALRDQGNMAEALADLSSLAAGFPADPLIHFHLAVTTAQAGQPAQALQSLERCLQLKPDYGLARAVRADLLDAAGQAAAAVAEYRQAVLDTPGDPWIRFGLVHLLLRQKQTADAAAALQPVEALLLPEQQAEMAELQRLQAELKQAAVTDSAAGQTTAP